MNSLISNINKSKLLQLIISTVCLCAVFTSISSLYEKITHVPYENTSNNQKQILQVTAGFIMVERGISWLIGSIILKITKSSERQNNQNKNNLKYDTQLVATGFGIFLAMITIVQSKDVVYAKWIEITDTFKYLSVVFVGVYFSEVRNKYLKLTISKMIGAIIITICLLSYTVPRLTQQTTQPAYYNAFLGFIFLAVSLVSYGMVADNQASLKSQYRPSAIQLMTYLNKFTTVFAFLHVLLVSELNIFFWKVWDHPEFGKDLLKMSLISFIAQVIIYRMIIRFRQHFVPLVLCGRKIVVPVVMGFVKSGENNESLTLGSILIFLIVVIVIAYEILIESQNESISSEQSQSYEQYELAQTGEQSGKSEQKYQEISPKNLN